MAAAFKLPDSLQVGHHLVWVVVNGVRGEAYGSAYPYLAQPETQVEAPNP